MLDLHGEKTQTSTLEESRILEEVTLQKWGQFGSHTGALAPPGLGSHSAPVANHNQARGSYLHRP